MTQTVRPGHNGSHRDDMSQPGLQSRCIAPKARNTVGNFFFFWFLLAFIFIYFFNFYCYSITVVCLFDPSLHPTPTVGI